MLCMLLFIASEARPPADVASSFKEHGFVVLPNFFVSSELTLIRKLVHSSLDVLPWERSIRPGETWGLTAPDLVGSHGTFAPLLPAVSLSLGKPRLHDALRTALNGSSYVFADMGELQINRTSGWHRDILHGADASAYTNYDLWAAEPGSGEAYGMVRLIVYFEDHDGDGGGLHVYPGSHQQKGCKSRRCSGAQPFIEVPQDLLKASAPTILRLHEGDAVLFDMRLIHRGLFDPATGGERTSLQLTFGARNVFTQEWRAGDRLRRARVLAKAIEEAPSSIINKGAATALLLQANAAGGEGIYTGRCKLVRQASVAPCELGRSFGCDAASGSMWVANCRGTFRCAGIKVPCGYPPGRPVYNCSCATPARAQGRRAMRRAVQRNELRGRVVAICGPASYVSSSSDAMGIAHLSNAVEHVVHLNTRVEAGRMRLPPGCSTRSDTVYHAGAVLGVKVGGVDRATAYNALTSETVRAYYDGGVQEIVLAVESRSFRRTVNFDALSSRFNGSGMRFRKLKPSDVGGDKHRHLRTGIKALLDVLRQRPAAVLLFGFDFYSGTDFGFSDYYRGISTPLSSFHTRDELLLFHRLLRQHRNTLFIDSKLARVLEQHFALPFTYARTSPNATLVQPVAPDKIASYARAVVSPTYVEGPAEAQPWPPQFAFPAQTIAVQIQLGPNYNPIAPPDKNTFEILIDGSQAVARQLSRRFRAMPNVAVVWTAIGNASGVTTFVDYNESTSSGLAPVVTDDATVKSVQVVLSRQSVPIHRLSELLDSIPERLPIEMVQTNIEGYNLSALVSAGGALRRVGLLLSEVDVNGYLKHGMGVLNQHRHFNVALAAQGFAEMGCTKARSDTKLLVGQVPTSQKLACARGMRANQVPTSCATATTSKPKLPFVFIGSFGRRKLSYYASQPIDANSLVSRTYRRSNWVNCVYARPSDDGHSVAAAMTSMTLVAGAEATTAANSPPSQEMQCLRAHRDQLNALAARQPGSQSRRLLEQLVSALDESRLCARFTHARRHASPRVVLLGSGFGATGTDVVASAVPGPEQLEGT